MNIQMQILDLLLVKFLVAVKDLIEDPARILLQL